MKSYKQLQLIQTGCPMIKHCSFYVFFLFLLFGSNPTCAEEALDNQALKRRAIEEEIPLPPSLRGAVIKELPREDNFMKEFINMLMTLGAIITVLLLASYLLKRMANSRIQQMNESSEIKILERRSITAKTAVYLLDVRGAQYALVESHNGLILLPNVPISENDKE